MSAFRGEFGQARTLLEQALAKSVGEHATISDLLVLVRERELDDRYEKAHILELERRFEDALAAYRAIDADWEGFKDVRTQITLKYNFSSNDFR